MVEDKEDAFKVVKDFVSNKVEVSLEDIKIKVVDNNRFCVQVKENCLYEFKLLATLL